VEVVLDNEKKARTTLQAQLDSEKEKCSKLEKELKQVIDSLENLKTQHVREMEDLKLLHHKTLQIRLDQESEIWEAKLKEVSVRVSDKPKLRVDIPKLANVPQPTNSVQVDRLQTVVKQLEGQISALKLQLIGSGKARDELAEEVIKLNARLDAASKQVVNMTSLESELQDLNKRCVSFLLTNFL
jgi:hypothetical protein